MKKLTYSIIINKPVDFVFQKIMDKSVYPEWAKAWGEGMTYEGVWKQGSHISFFDISGSGTKAHVDEFMVPEHIKMTHVAMVEAGNREVAELDDTMKKWIGSKEEYYFSEAEEGATMLTIRMEADEAFEEMMGAWPKALAVFKETFER